MNLITGLAATGLLFALASVSSVAQSSPINITGGPYECGIIQYTSIPGCVYDIEVDLLASYLQGGEWMDRISSTTCGGSHCVNVRYTVGFNRTSDDGLVVRMPTVSRPNSFAPTIEELVHDGTYPRLISGRGMLPYQDRGPDGRPTPFVLAADNIGAVGGARWSPFTAFYPSSVGIPVPRPTCSFGSSSILIDHGRIVKAAQGFSDKSSANVQVTCSADATFKVSVQGLADLPTNLTGVTSRISFDGQDYTNTYSYTNPLSINVESTILWDSTPTSGTFNASGVVTLDVL